VVSTITFAVEPEFLLTAREEPMPFDQVMADFDQLVAENEHFEFYWFPHTDNCNTKRNNRTAGPAAPLGRVSGWVDDELLSNGIFQVACSVGRAVPATIPGIAKISSRALSARTYTDIPYKVFTSPRRVRFVEMEYAVPRAHGADAVRGARTILARHPVAFPVEFRLVAADDALLSPAYERDSAYVAVHVFEGMASEAPFREVEALMRTLRGRPHWGKHSFLEAAELAPLYPEWEAFQAARAELDPGGRFENDWTRRVLGHRKQRPSPR
jgi:L-gulono-1,4-lactone dehydrogenase